MPSFWILPACFVEGGGHGARPKLLGREDRADVGGDGRLRQIQALRGVGSFAAGGGLPGHEGRRSVGQVLRTLMWCDRCHHHDRAIFGRAGNKTDKSTPARRPQPGPSSTYPRQHAQASGSVAVHRQKLPGVYLLWSGPSPV